MSRCTSSQGLIRDYQTTYDCRFVSLSTGCIPDGLTFFKETLYNAQPDKISMSCSSTPGGDGETAIRLARQAQARCQELTVKVPEQATGAPGTLFVHRCAQDP